MSTKPRLRRLDWTLSATPTRRGVRVFLVAAIPSALLGGCILTFLIGMSIARGPRAPERSFTALDFFPSRALYLSGYDVFEPPRWGGYKGDDDDAYAVYDPALKTVGNIYVFVYYESYWNDALKAYQEEIQPKNYMNSYKPVAWLTFESDRAQEQILLCSDETYAPRNATECDYIARYDEFVINVSAVVRQDQPSMAEFEKVLRAVDQRAIELLGPTPAPMP